MPELVEQMYCSQQIVIPPKFPYILKRFCKAAIKTQPYDLLRWSFEYFKALAENRPPPVKLRLEYPIYSTEGGLTRGCLKVIAHQLLNIGKNLPLYLIRKAWRGFCLDPNELRRIFCLCEVYMRQDYVPLLHFIAVAGGMLTKNLTYTMILLCEVLTKEPDGGSAAIPADDFLAMYLFLARMDASRDIRYVNGYREGETPRPEEEEIEEEETLSEATVDPSLDDFWQGAGHLRRLSLVDDSVTTNPRLSQRSALPPIGRVARSLSAERAAQIERENYMRERKDRAILDEDVEAKMKQLSSSIVQDKAGDDKAKEEDAEEKEEFKPIRVWDEDDKEIPFEFYGEPKIEDDNLEEQQKELDGEEETKQEAEHEEYIQDMIEELYQARAQRLADLEQTFEDIARIVDKFKLANYDLGMVAGRQMSITSGEFIVQHIEKEIMDYIDEQIAVLPDPDLKKKKAKPEEVEMVRNLLYNFLDENMDIIVPEIEEVEEEELPIPEIVVVYAVPGIGPFVSEEMICDVEEYIADVSKNQADMVMPRNFRHFLSPPLEKFEEYQCEDHKKEELACSGVFTN
ncbi:uncharacterized protein LOC133533036 isoform X1 [Cydia pomonella]|uniref:uncharacterized protein LOC133533036 isoform X1 n=1 Tax=Cydia pomonella TaxID=82600 RepID=UPI002ADDD142|nr:uncharacterized protein LOC133533036 isoform X1 [Cydia pomonella]